MKLLLGRSEMRDLDAFSIGVLGVPGLTLMENAGAAVAAQVVQEAPAAGRVYILCGPGNNGGDGMVAARRLAMQGMTVEVLLAAAQSAYRDDALTQLTLVKNLHLPLRQVDDEGGLAYLQSRCPGPGDVLVDALLGTGLEREVTGHFAQLIGVVNRFKGLKVALDIPSGVDADTGQVRGMAVSADLTVTFAPAKLGCLLPPARFYHVGRLVVRDIGLCGTATPLPDCVPCDSQVYRYLGVDCHPLSGGGLPPELAAKRLAFLMEQGDAAKALLPLHRGGMQHKGDFGHAFLLAGGPGFHGAAALGVHGCLASGVGLCTLLSDTVSIGIATTATPAVMSRLLDAEDEACLAELAALVARKATALGAGPGFLAPGNGEALEVLLAALPPDIPAVLDAEAVNLVAAKPETFLPLLAKRPVDKTLFTPHPGEAKRLYTALANTDNLNDIQHDRFAFVRNLARLSHATVLLKGASSCVSDGQVVIVNPSGNAHLATGGSGDVLTGLATGLASQGLPLLPAAAAAAYAHGLAADIIAGRGAVTSIDPARLPVVAGEILGLWTHGTLAQETGEPCHD